MPRTLIFSIEFLGYIITECSKIHWGKTEQEQFEPERDLDDPNLVHVATPFCLKVVGISFVLKQNRVSNLKSIWDKSLVFNEK